MAPTTVVTGAAGRIGRGVGAALRKLGHRVVGLDVLPAPAGLIGDSCDHFVQCDLAAAGAGAGEAHGLLHKAMEGVSSVVHCAAWPGPSAVPPPAVVASGAATPPQITLETTPPTLLLRDNVAATAAVCDAAVAAGATRFVFSSSAFAMGYSHAASGPQAYAPRYLPVDEAHGAMPHESYGLSKLVGEEVLECAARTAVHASFVSLRFTNIVKREKFHELPWPAPTLDQPPTMVLWAYTHEDDVIDAHVAAVLRPSAAAPGTHEPYLICAADSRYAEPTLPLLASVLGIVETPLRHPMAGNASPLSAAKARARLGFTPRSWQDGKGTRNQPAAADTEVKGRDAELSGGGGVSPPRGILVRGSAAARRALRDAGLRRFPLDGFALESGARLPPGATLAYKVHGPPVGSSPGGIILHPTSFDAVHDELEYNIGSGRTLDTDRYTVIVPNMLGNGVSASPSTLATGASPAAGTPDGPPPRFSVADNVRAQRMLLQSLGVIGRDADAAGGGDAHGLASAAQAAAACAPRAPLALVYGYSMGALQAFEWAVSHPHEVARVAAVCGASRCGDLNTVFLRSLEATLQADAAWNPRTARFTGRPSRALEAFGAIYAGWGVGAGWYLNRRYAAAGFGSAEEFVTGSYLGAFAECDADDLLSQIHTWRTADVSRHAGGDLALALRRVRAKVLLMPCDSDRYFTLTEAQREAELLAPRAMLAPLRSDAGHRAGDPHRPELSAEAAFLRSKVHELLASE